MEATLLTISNGELTVQINPYGATLWSIKDIVDGAEDTEYLWQGNAEYWEDRAPNIFPYVGRMSNKHYTLDGKEYTMDIHGFAKDSQFEIIKKQPDSVTLRLKDDEAIYAQYPYHFVFDITYKLEGRKLITVFHVENQDDRAMYFGIGGHPGFHVPMEAGLEFADYYLEFEKDSQPKRICFSANGLVEGQPVPYQLKDGNKLPLYHSMFDDDAIVLKDLELKVTLKSDKGSKAVRVESPDMTYLGFWHTDCTDAPFVCIEPWGALPSREGVVEDLATQPGLIKLEVGAVYDNVWSIEIL